MIEIKNLPPYHERYVLARYIDGNYWYWGSWNCEEEAYKVARNIGGHIFDRSNNEDDFEEEEYHNFIDDMYDDAMETFEKLRDELHHQMRRRA